MRLLPALLLLAQLPALAHADHDRDRRDDREAGRQCLEREADRERRSREARSDEQTSDHRLMSEANDDGSALLRVLAPERAMVRISEGTRELFADTIPAAFNGTEGRFYKVKVTFPNGAGWEKKIELHRGVTSSLWVNPPPGPGVPPQPPQPQPPQPPQPQPPQWGPQFDVVRVAAPACPADAQPVTLAEVQGQLQFMCGKLGQWDIARLANGAAMDGPGYGCKVRVNDTRSLGTALCKFPSAPQPLPQPPPEPQHPAQPVPPPPPVVVDAPRLEQIKGAIGNEAFSEKKVGVLASAMDGRLFTCAQVGEIVDLYSFSKDKLAALRILNDHIADRGNTFTLMSHFTFASDKTQAQQILAR